MVCQHEELEYCPCCDQVRCKKCGRTWGMPPLVHQPAYPNYWPYWPYINKPTWVPSVFPNGTGDTSKYTITVTGTNT